MVMMSMYRMLIPGLCKLLEKGLTVDRGRVAVRAIADESKVWSLTPFLFAHFPQSRIGVKKCSVTFTPSRVHLTVSFFSLEFQKETDKNEVGARPGEDFWDGGGVCVRELGNFGQYDGDDANVPNAHPGADMGQNFENFWKVKISVLLILILTLKTAVSKYLFWYWYWKMHFQNIDFDIDIESFGSFDIDIGIDIEKK